MFVLLLVSIRSLVLLGHGFKFFCFFFYLKNPLFHLNTYNIYNWFLMLNTLSSFIISESLKSASSWSLTSVWSCRNILWYNFSWPWTSHPTRSSSLSRQLSPFSSWTRISSGKSMSWTPCNYLASLYWELHNFPKLSFKNWKQRSANTITWNLNSQQRVLVVQSWYLIWRLMTKKLTSVKWVTHNFKSKRS